MRYRDTPPDDEEPWAWLDEPRGASPVQLIPDSGADPVDIGPDRELNPGAPQRDDRWMDALPHTPDAADTDAARAWWFSVAHRLPGRAWAALAATIAILAGVAAISATNTDTGGGGEQVVATATPSSTPPTPEDACTGLSGTVVTDRAGDPATVPGVIASFQAAYYLQRDAEAATRLLAPEAGIAVEGLAAGIASIPPGTTHCVAITPISETTANVHVAELRADRHRIDYLQLVNTRPGESGVPLLISNIQGQG
ncbi:hypothetical protein ACFVVM_16745 [Nocardia sp. NPDC058176]|uniref:hypothetical protein n=1 Tax=Nocardia sp. NPDC058176 TaxID=3346368 RepID=UPI0036DCFFB3